MEFIFVKMKAVEFIFVQMKAVEFIFVLMKSVEFLCVSMKAMGFIFSVWNQWNLYVLKWRQGVCICNESNVLIEAVKLICSNKSRKSSWRTFRKTVTNLLLESTECKSNIGKPKNTRRRDLEKEINVTRKAWKERQEVAPDRRACVRWVPVLKWGWKALKK